MDGWGPAIDARSVFRRDRERLSSLLSALSSADWERATACGNWLVRDVVVHVLGDDLSRLSRSRDLYAGPDAPAGAESLADFIARLNDRWVRACAGLSPSVIVEQLEATTPAVLAFWDGLDLSAQGDPVTWAGPRPAPVWLDCARDFTEYWTHQRQVRESLGVGREDDPETDRTALDTFLRAVPYTLRDAGALVGDTVSIAVDGPAGGRWSWRYEDHGWAWCARHPPEPTTSVTVADEILWRLCTRMIQPSDARRSVVISGRRDLGEALTEMVSIEYGRRRGRSRASVGAAARR